MALSCNSSGEPPRGAPPEAVAKSEPGAPAMELPAGVSVYRDEVSDTPVKTQVSIDLLVGEKRTEAELEQILEAVYESARTRTGYKHHASPTHLRIRAYPTQAHADSGMGQWVGQLTRIGIAGALNIEIPKPAVTTVSSVNNSSALSETTRRAVWAEVIKAEDRADHETKNLPPAERFEQNQARSKKYRSEVLKKYGVSDAEWSSIKAEGMANNWPFPKY